MATSLQTGENKRRCVHGEVSVNQSFVLNARNSSAPDEHFRRKIRKEKNLESPRTDPRNRRSRED